MREKEGFFTWILIYCKYELHYFLYATALDTHTHKMVEFVVLRPVILRNIYLGIYSKVKK